MRKIKKLNQLPPEFKLEEYDVISNLTPEDWKDILYERSVLIDLLKNGCEVNYQSGFGIYHSYYNPNKTTFFDESKKYTSTELTEIINTDAVRLLDLRQSFEIWNTVEYNNELKGKIFFPKNCDLDLNQALELYEKRALFPGGESIAVTLNILASDEEIIRDIKSFIASYRRFLQIKPPSPLIIPNEKNICNWTQWKVIQFMDLQLWELENDVKISYPLLGKILFPDEFEKNTSEIVRKTIEPNVMKLMKAINDYFDQVGDSDERAYLT